MGATRSQPHQQHTPQGPTDSMELSSGSRPASMTSSMAQSSPNKPPHLHDHASQQAPHHVAAPHIAGQHAVTDEVHHRARVVTNDLERRLRAGTGTVVVHTRQLCCFGHDGVDEVCLVVVGHSLVYM